ncbi:MAG: AbrB/MazE/SpoVT family DNA-binding domain-containing protein [Nanoarchaeota archaeon]
MEVELTRISEKGQVVIPSSLRRVMKINKADQFLVFGEGSTIILKKVEKSAFEKSFEEITKPLQRVVKEEGFSREDLNRIIKEVRSKNA